MRRWRVLVALVAISSLASCGGETASSATSVTVTETADEDVNGNLEVSTTTTIAEAEKGPTEESSDLAESESEPMEADPELCEWVRVNIVASNPTPTEPDEARRYFDQVVQQGETLLSSAPDEIRASLQLVYDQILTAGEIAERYDWDLAAVPQDEYDVLDGDAGLEASQALMDHCDLTTLDG